MGAQQSVTQGVGSGQSRRILFLGGDQREAFAARRLAGAGWHVRASGLPVSAGLRLQSEPRQALGQVGVLVTPIRGLDEAGRCYTLPACHGVRVDAKLVSRLPVDGLWLCGRRTERVVAVAEEARRRLVSIVERDDFAILNAVPTAEGAVVAALQRSVVTLHGSRALILGFGRTGRSLAWLLRSMGARVHVWVRRSGPAARAVSYGYGVLRGENLDEHLADFRFVFNTVPSLVLTRQRLEATDPRAVIIDIASAPGGTDFAAAESLERTAHLALGLPGKVAPETAGSILAAVIERLVTQAETSPGD